MTDMGISRSFTILENILKPYAAFDLQVILQPLPIRFRALECYLQGAYGN